MANYPLPPEAELATKQGAQPRLRREASPIESCIPLNAAILAAQMRSSNAREPDFHTAFGIDCLFRSELPKAQFFDRAERSALLNMPRVQRRFSDVKTQVS